MRGATRNALFLFASLALMDCQRAEPPPLGSVKVVVQTDVPVDRLQTTLRIDLYDQAGTWFASRSFAASRVGQWPASFAIQSPHDDATSVLVRARLYPSFATRAYEGERFLERGSPDPSAPDVPTLPGDRAPRLVEDGIDVTPEREPEPTATIDRLVRLTTTPGVIRTALVSLSGECFGTMADVARARTCVDREATLSAVDDDDALARASKPLVLASFGAPTPCTATPRKGSTSRAGASLRDEQVCVPGGVFVLGSPDVSNFETEVISLFDGMPPRIAIEPPLLVDVYEVSVGRFRAALAAGMTPPDQTPFRNEKPLGTAGSPSSQLATYSNGRTDREDYPLNDVSWKTARAFCVFDGGDLLSEAQWEWVASTAGRATKSAFAWGDTPPTCERAIYGRFVGSPVGLGVGIGDDCTRHYTPPLPFGIASLADEASDVTPLGVVGMGGGVEEWTLDAYRSFSAPCWLFARLVDPRCWQDEAPVRSQRGGSWSQSSRFTLAARRGGFPVKEGTLPGIAAPIGFRCARSGA